MKILWMSDAIVSHSGFGAQTYFILRGLKRLGHEIVSISDALNWASYKPFYYDVEEKKIFDEKQIDSEKFKDSGVKVYPISRFGSYNTIKDIYVTEKPDVFICFNELRNLQSVISLDKMIRKDCPLIIWHIWDNPPYPYFNESKYPCFDHIVCVTEFAKDLLASSGKVENLNYIPLGVDLDMYRKLPDEEVTQLRQKYEKLVGSEFEFVVGYVGRNQTRKRIYDMMSLFGRWAGDDKGKVLFLHTDPTEPGSPPLLKVRKALVPGECTILFTIPSGETSDIVNGFFNIFDVNLNISWNEGFGLPILEAMAAGTPTITNENAGSKQLVNESNGWLLKNSFTHYSYGGPPTELTTRNYVSEDQVIKAIDEAYQNRELLKQKSLKGMELAREYDINLIIRQWDKFLRSAKENHRPLERPTFSIL